MIKTIRSIGSFNELFPRFWYIFIISFILLLISLISGIDHDDSPGFGIIASPIILPMGSAIITICSISLCRLLGLIIYKSPIGIIWSKMGNKVLLFSILALITMAFSKRLGLNQNFTDYKGASYSEITLLNSMFCYLVVVFPIVNLPYWKKTSEKILPPLPIIHNK